MREINSIYSVFLFMRTRLLWQFGRCFILNSNAVSAKILNVYCQISKVKVHFVKNLQILNSVLFFTDKYFITYSLRLFLLHHFPELPFCNIKKTSCCLLIMFTQISFFLEIIIQLSLRDNSYQQFSTQNNIFTDDSPFFFQTVWGWCPHWSSVFFIKTFTQNVFQKITLFVKVTMTCNKSARRSNCISE